MAGPNFEDLDWSSEEKDEDVVDAPYDLEDESYQECRDNDGGGSNLGDSTNLESEPMEEGDSNMDFERHETNQNEETHVEGTNIE
ncbi:hypothetical protein L6452_37893 [Arctium lappa]|uniref:Uncharacterized protein n=1 Tax=Arctium lappa TaxID=4217 RepID=A0ACB8Y478_ARCLA|nr:hypothetical protein L6452_37893 [Arctium lappa]